MLAKKGSGSIAKEKDEGVEGYEEKADGYERSILSEVQTPRGMSVKHGSESGAGVVIPRFESQLINLKAAHSDSTFGRVTWLEGVPAIVAANYCRSVPRRFPRC